MNKWMKKINTLNDFLKFLKEETDAIKLVNYQVRIFLIL